MSTATADVRLASCNRPERARTSASRCEIMSSVQGFSLASAAFRFMSSPSPFKKAMKYRTRKTREFKLALRRSPDGVLGIGQPIQVELAEALLP